MGRPSLVPAIFRVSLTICWLVTLATIQGNAQCPNDIVKTTDDGKSTGSSATWSSGSVECDRTSGTPFQIGITTVTCSDDNDATCTFRVTIKDDEAPVFTKCPVSQRKFIPGVNPSSQPHTAAVTVTWDAPAASDNSGPGGFEQPSPTHESGSLFPLGVTPVVYTARDYSGNTAEESACSFDVRVVVKPPQNHTFAKEWTSASITVLFPQLGDSIAEYYILHYQGKDTIDEVFGSRTSFLVSEDEDQPYIHTYIERTEINLSPGELYFVEVGSDKTGATGIISTIQQWTKPLLGVVEFIPSPPSSVRILLTQSTGNMEQYKVSVSGNGVVLYLAYVIKTTDDIVVDSLVPGSSHTVQVTAVVGSGDMRVESEPESALINLGQVNASQLVAYNYTESTIHVAWLALPERGNDKEPYMLFIDTNEEEGQPEERFLTIFYEGSGTGTAMAQFQGLGPNTEYHIRLVTNLGLSLNVTQKTRPVRVTNIHPTEVLDDSITLEWNSVSLEESNGYSYEVSISPSPDKDYDHVTAANTRTISSLTKGTEYFLSVVSIYDGVRSVPQTLMVTAGVTESVATTPLNVVALEVGIALGVIVLVLAVILFIVCCKYRNLKSPQNILQSTGHTNIAMAEKKHYTNSPRVIDSGGVYEEPNPPAETEGKAAVSSTSYENTVMGVASGPPTIKKKPLLRKW